MTLISAGNGMSTPIFSLPFWRLPVLSLPRRLVRILRTTFCATSPRSWASANIEPREINTRLDITADRPSARSLSMKPRTMGTVSADSFMPPGTARCEGLRAAGKCRGSSALARCAHLPRSTGAPPQRR